MATLTELVKPGNVAVVTGTSSGIGRAAALRWVVAGMHVWMLDCDEVELETALKMAQKACQNGGTAKAVTVDVSDEEALKKVADDVFANHSTVHILFNNAGVGLGGGALTESSTVSKTLGVNFYGPLHGCLAFVPRMKERGEAGIVINTGSKQGITMPPGNLTYNVSKAALKCYTEGLEHEFMKERTEGDGKLRAVLLVPGWINTSILYKAQREQQGEKFDPEKVFFHEGKPQPGAWMPSQVIDYLVQQVEKGSFYVICPDNDVDVETDKLRITWTFGDITEDRPPLSRWHPDYKDKFTQFLETNKK
mmetsp:Transcript_5368/g.10371  ORF Transcript_5368/g.10371 Transcript_5368/m.10371 type:complete len:307 (-) Transcript_5368:1085-2005(-)|eukprot:scaffold6761_cov159-Amphora_coffeaeformis.AAC.10